jgi:hypothetical protein
MSVAPVPHLLTHRSAGPIATVTALFLALALAASLAAAAQTRAELEGRIAELSRQPAGQGAYWRARADACESAARRLAAASSGPAPAPRSDRAVSRAAAELANRPPQGIDACARMESADAAVLRTLK